MKLHRHIATGLILLAATVMSAAPRLLYSKTAPDNVTRKIIYEVYSRHNANGFEIKSGDPRLPGTIATVTEGNFNRSALPDGLTAYLDAYERFITTASETEISRVASMRASLAAHKEVLPLVESKWGQGAPYNDMCPVLPTGERTVTGCEATAMAQILYRHRYPTKLLADIPSYTTGSYKLKLPAISAGESYDWDNILPVYSGTSTNEQNVAVAKLMLHTGCALQMDYGPESGAAASIEALINCFGMDRETTRLKSRYDYEMPQWDAMLYNEMTEGRPVIYEGRDVSGAGHAFVIDGYKDGAYHVNWGWDGYADGYYDICILMGFGLDNYMVIGIQPDNGITDTPETDAGNASLRCGSLDRASLTDMTVADGTLTGKAKFNLTNISDAAVSCQISIGFRDNQGKIVNAGTPFPLNIGKSSSKKCIIRLSVPAAEGDFFELFAIESKDGTAWTPCAKESKDAGVAFLIKNNKPEYVDIAPKLSAVIKLAPECSGTIEDGNYLNITISNTGYKEFYDRISLRAGTGEELPVEPFLVAGLTVPHGRSTTLSAWFQPESAGTYNIVAFAGNNEIGRASITFTSDSERRQNNEAAYRADIEAIDALQAELDRAAEKIAAQYPGFDIESAKSPILEKIDEMRRAADEAFVAVAQEGTYQSVYNGDEVLTLIEKMREAAQQSGIDCIMIDGKAAETIYTIDGIRLEHPAAGRINIVVFSDGTRTALLP